MTPTMEHDLAAYLRVGHLGDPERETELDLLITGTPLDRLHLTGRGPTAGPAVALDLDLDVRGLRVEDMAPWLERIGCEPRVEHLDADLRLRADLSPAGPERTEASALFALEDLSVSADGVPALELLRAEVHAPCISGAAREVASVLVEGLRVEATTLPDGRTSAAGLAFGGSAPASSGTPEPAAPTNGSSPQAKGTPVPAAQPGSLRIGSIALRDFAFALRDESCAPAVDLELRLVESEAGDLVLGAPDSSSPLPSPVRLTMEAPGFFDRLDLVGECLLHGDERDVDLQLDLSGLAPSALEGWLARAGLAFGSSTTGG